MVLIRFILGGGRYVPSGAQPAPAVNVNFRERSNNAGIINVDPFTGGSSYSSGGKQDYLMKKHIPSTVYLQFDSCDASKILVKLKEFNGQLPDDSAKVSDGELEMEIKLIL